MYSWLYLTARGFNIGTRLIEEFLANTSLPRCLDLRETAEVISKVRILLCFPDAQVGFKMFLNITPTVTLPTSFIPGAEKSDITSNVTGAEAGLDLSKQTKEFGLVLTENPLDEFVELPPEVLQGLSLIHI